jgi:SAM-dependent methyltransferase
VEQRTAAVAEDAMWKGDASLGWVEAQSMLDAMFSPFEHLLADAVGASSASSVLDVGCGTGATTVAAAGRLAPGGSCVGVDISAAMLSAARARATPPEVAVTFRCDDAQTHAFEPRSFDMIISRFGVMFFSNPEQAFANLRSAARHGANMRLLAWRAAADNPFMTVAERATAPLIPGAQLRQESGPGQFAFADKGRVEHILSQSGWTDIDISPLDVDCGFSEDRLDFYFTRLGPVARILPSLDSAIRASVIEAARTGFQPFVQGGEVRFTAACWDIRAVADTRG